MYGVLLLKGITMKSRDFINLYLIPKKYQIKKVKEFGEDLSTDLAKLLKHVSVPVIFDVGANVGQSAKLFRGLWPNAIIYSFEPLPEAFAKLQREASVNTNWKVHQIALANDTGRERFFVHPFSVLSSLLPLAKECPEKEWLDSLERAGKREIEVETITLDQFCRQAAVQKIDLLKLDVQGAEHLVLQGAIRALERKEIGFILSEINIAPLYRGQTKFHDLCRFLDEYGYAFNGLYRSRFDMHHRLGWFDALFRQTA
jgi:FkbM family methyltransferase